MPTYFIVASWRYFARSYDLLYEPCHVHAQKGIQKLSKFWIFADGTVELADKKGMTKREVSLVQQTIESQIETIKIAYESYCRTNRVPINYKTKRTDR
jgi:hypothetical protein